MPRSRALDRSLATESRLIWIVTAVILVLGALVVLWVASPGERERREVMGRVAIGHDADRVTALLGQPTECPTGSVEHLRAWLPEEWAPAAMEAAITRIGEETAFRWVYPLDDDDRGSCAGAEGQTEIGFDAAGRVLWYVAVTGGTSPVLPEDYSPEADTQ